MINEQLLRYIKQQLSLNVSKEVISTNLKSQGWTDADLNEAFAYVAPSATPPPQPAAPAPEIKPASVVMPATPATSPDLNSPAQTAQSEFATMPQASTPQYVASAPNTVSHKSKKIFLAVLVILLLGLAGGGTYVYYSRISSSDSRNTLEYNQSNAIVTEADTNTGDVLIEPNLTKVCQITGVSVVIPNGLNYGCDTYGNGTNARLSITYWSKSLLATDVKPTFFLNVEKFSGQSDFDDYSKDVIFDDLRFKFNLIDSDYQIGGISGLYYEGETLIGSKDTLRRMIMVPSKLITISIDELKNFGSLNDEMGNISKTDLNSIVNSISFDKVINNKFSQQSELGSTKICSTNEISVILPNRSNYSCTTTESNVFSRINIEYFDPSMINVTDSGGIPLLLSIEKFASQERFRSVKISDEDFNLIDTNYTISGTAGLYYEGKTSLKGYKKIVAPSKLIIIGIPGLDNLKYYGVNDALKSTLKKEIDLMVNSISF